MQHDYDHVMLDVRLRKDKRQVCFKARRVGRVDVTSIVRKGGKVSVKRLYHPLCQIIDVDDVEFRAVPIDDILCGYETLFEHVEQQVLMAVSDIDIITFKN